jgi:hypothetical protein
VVVAAIASPELLQAVLREHLADPTAHIADLQIEPILTDSYSGNCLYRARIAWTSSALPEVRSVTWMLKRWLSGGHGERLLGVDRPLEALAWERGILRLRTHSASRFGPSGYVTRTDGGDPSY